MHLYELINPSDCVTFEVALEDRAAADVVAGLVCLLLGHGGYAVHHADGGVALGILLMATAEDALAALGWHRPGVSPEDFDVAIATRRDAIREALGSCAAVDLSDRAALRAAVGDDPEALGRWNEAKRTSLNDICGRAAALARSHVLAARTAEVMP